MDILVTIKEDLAALRKDTQDVKRELETVRDDTKSMRQNTLQDIIAGHRFKTEGPSGGNSKLQAEY